MKARRIIHHLGVISGEVVNKSGFVALRHELAGGCDDFRHGEKMGRNSSGGLRLGARSTAIGLRMTRFSKSERGFSTREGIYTIVYVASQAGAQPFVSVRCV